MLITATLAAGPDPSPSSMRVRPAIGAVSVANHSALTGFEPGIGEPEQPGGRRAVGGHHDRSGGDGPMAGRHDRPVFGAADTRHPRTEAHRSHRQPAGQLVGNGLHADRRDGRVAARQAAEDGVEHPGRRRELVVELDAAEQRAEEALDDLGGEAGRVERLPGAAIGASEQLRAGATADPLAQPGDPQLVGRRADGRAGGGQRMLRLPKRVGHPVERALPPHQGARVERSQVERMQVELPARLRIRGEQHLEPAIEQEPADGVGADAAAHRVARFSSTAVCSPAAVVARAQASPARPAPTTATSTEGGTELAIAGGF